MRFIDRPEAVLRHRSGFTTKSVGTGADVGTEAAYHQNSVDNDLTPLSIWGDVWLRPICERLRELAFRAL